MKKVRVLLADDHTIFREGLRMLLSQEKDLQVVGEAGDGAEAVRLVKELKPHVVVMDIGMPNLNGVEATRQILETAPDVRVLGLSVYRDRRFVVGMLGAGAKGYLLKNCAVEELVLAIRNVMAGHVYVSSRVSGVVVEDYVRQVRGGGEPSLLALTEREREVVRFLALGQHNKQIAASLGLSDKTVETHRQHIMEKLGLHSIADLTRFAIREGLVSPDD
jgi:DNA-binding NarL/FixJ family response regulator